MQIARKRTADEVREAYRVRMTRQVSRSFPIAMRAGPTSGSCGGGADRFFAFDRLI